MPHLRRIHVLQLALKLIGIGVVTYVVLRIAFGRPLYPVPLFTVALLILGIVVNHALQRTAASRCCSNRPASWPPSLSLGR